MRIGRSFQTQRADPVGRRWRDSSNGMLRDGDIEGSGALQLVSGNPNTPNGQFDFHPNQAFTFGAEGVS